MSESTQHPFKLEVPPLQSKTTGLRGMIKDFFDRNAAIFKGLVILCLIGLLMIPMSLIRGLINEREHRQVEAIHEVSSKWANNQNISGPIISIPYIEKYTEEVDGVTKTKERRKTAHFLPDNLSVNGELIPEERERGIFKVAVYQSKLQIHGDFKYSTFTSLNIEPENILWDQASMALGISDLRGIEEQVQLNWESEQSYFDSGLPNSEVLQKGISTPLAIQQGDTKDYTYPFSFDLNLKGSQNIYFVPVGKETTVALQSTWKDPSFAGAFLPDDRVTNNDGFTADWKVLHLNRNYPQSWIGKKHQIGEAAFGVNLISPTDNYQKSERSVKYALLIIALTFMVFFFVEVLNGKSIHPFQYILVGLALCVFYTLLISISEHLNYNYAYIIAAAMTVVLVSLYARSVFKSFPLALLTGGVLGLLYAFLFTTIQLQEHALLIGSLGLFLCLAIVMYFSRKIDWYNIRGKKEMALE